MALVVEDGTGVADANSYIDLDDLEAYAAERGLTIATTDADNEVFILRAMDYIEARPFQGKKYLADQALQWPRDLVYIDGYLIGVDVIPANLKKAVSQLVIEQVSGVSLYPEAKTSTTVGNITRETVGPLTTEYSAMGTVASTSPIKFASVELFLKPLLSGCGNALQTIRV
jgi:hypothetical protein